MQHPQHSPNRVGDELRLRRVLIMLGTAHLHHPAPFSLKNAQKLITPRNPRFFGPNPDFFVHERKPFPPVFGALGSEHRVGAKNVEVGRQILEQQRLGELLDGEHVDEQGVAAEALERQRFEDGLGGDDGGA